MRGRFVGMIHTGRDLVCSADLMRANVATKLKCPTCGNVSMAGQGADHTYRSAEQPCGRIYSVTSFACVVAFSLARFVNFEFHPSLAYQRDVFLEPLGLVLL